MKVLREISRLLFLNGLKDQVINSLRNIYYWKVIYKILYKGNRSK